MDVVVVHIVVDARSYMKTSFSTSLVLVHEYMGATTSSSVLDPALRRRFQRRRCSILHEDIDDNVVGARSCIMPTSQSHMIEGNLYRKQGCFCMVTLGQASTSCWFSNFIASLNCSSFTCIPVGSLCQKIVCVSCSHKGCFHWHYWNILVVVLKIYRSHPIDLQPSRTQTTKACLSRCWIANI